MKKQLLLLLSLLAVSTAAFAGCTTPTNDKEKTNVNNGEVIQERQNNEDSDDCEDGNCGGDHKFIHPRTPRIRKDRTTDENGDQAPPPCLPKEPHKDDGRHIPAPPPAPKPMPVPQPQN